MSRTKFSIAYDGDDLHEGVMDVRDLAPALLAVGQLFDAANSTLNGEVTDIKINVKATEIGSFEIELEVIQTTIQSLWDFFGREDISTAANLIALIFGTPVLVGLIWLIKKLMGRSVDKNKIEKISKNHVRLTIENKTYEVPIKLIRLYQDLTVRTALDDLIYKPLQKPGIDVFKSTDGEHTEEVNKNESHYFAAPPLPEEELKEESIEMVFSIVSLAFRENSKWKLYDGNNTISVSFQDKDFFHRINNSEISFSKGDELVCQVKIRQFRINNELKSEYIVEKVRNHKSAEKPVQTPFLNLESESSKHDGKVRN